MGKGTVEIIGIRKVPNKEDKDRRDFKRDEVASNAKAQAKTGVED